MTPYAAEFAIALLAVVGAGLAIVEFGIRRDWWMVFFFAVFIIAPLWFAVAGYRTLAYGEADWLFNRAVSFWVRVPVVVGLYVLAVAKRHERNGHAPRSRW